MKKMILLTLTVCLLFCLTACGGGDKHIEVSDISADTVTDVAAASDPESTELSSTPEVSSEAAKPAISSTEACDHKYSAATCTAAAKCTLCGAKKGKALGHNFKSGTCSRCGAKDANYATYKNGGKNTILRTTATGKKTTLTIDISSAEDRIKMAEQHGTKMTLSIDRTHFYEADGWLYFVQENTYTYDDISSESYEVFRIKTDGTKQTQINTVTVTEDKGIAVAGVFGFAEGKLFYSVEDADRGTYTIYGATVSKSLTDLTKQGKKIEQADAGCFFKDYKLKDGWLYYSLTKGVYNTETGKTDLTDLGNYKIKLDGSGKKKVS